VEFGIVVEELQQRFAARAPLAHPQDVFRRGIEAHDEQVPVEQDDPRAQAVEDVFRLIANVGVV
jgi:hypothetical protein